MDRGMLAKELFEQGYNCSQAVVLAFKDLINIDEEDLKAMSSSFGGGISRLREVCGCISGMALVIGYLKGRYNNDEGKAKHYQLIQELSLKFKEKFNSINCATLLNIKNEISKPTPEKRSKEYYLKRPCGNYIYHMAKIMQEYLENE